MDVDDDVDDDETYVPPKPADLLAFVKSQMYEPRYRTYAAP